MLKNNKHALPISITKLGEVRFLQMFQCRVANATQIVLCRCDWQKLENMKNDPNNTRKPQLYMALSFREGGPIKPSLGPFQYHQMEMETNQSISKPHFQVLFVFVNEILLLLSFHFKIIIIYIYIIYFFGFLFETEADRPAPKHRSQLTTWQVFCQVERRFHSRESNYQPLL